MEVTVAKRRYQTGTARCLILLFFVLIMSCNGQDKLNVPKDSKVESKTIRKDYSAPLFSLGSNTIPNDFFAPLFYDGQLCHWTRRILQDKSGNLWFGNSGGITKYDGESFTNYTEKDGLINNDVWSLTIDHNGIIWIGTLNGVSSFDGEAFTTFKIPQAAVQDPKPILSGHRVSSIIEDQHGTLWFGTDGYGICKYDGKSFSHMTAEDGLCDNNVSDIMEDKEGNIWIGTMYGGVSRYNGTSFTNFTKDGVIEGIEVGGLYEDKNGNIWFAAENNGVYRYDGKSFTNLYKEEGLISNGIQSIFEDKEGRFWFGGWKGLFRYDGNSFFPVTKKGPWK